MTQQKRQLAGGFLLGGLFLLTSFGASVQKGERDGTWKIATDLLAVTVDGSKGGRISSLVYKPVGKETVYQNGGFCLDHFWEQNWPGEFLDADYEMTVTQPAPGRIDVTGRRTSTGIWGQTPAEPMSGLQLTRRMSFRDGAAGIEVEIAVANPTAATKMFGFWAQQCFTPAGRHVGVEYFRPGQTGLNRAVEPENRGIPGAPEVCYAKVPVAGWTAAVDPQAGAGAVFLMDFNDLAWFYNCVGMNTVEWMYERTVLPPGKEWRTAYAIRPFAGLTNVAYASRRVVAGIEPQCLADGVKISFSLLRSLEAVQKGKLKGEVVNLIKNQSVPIPEQAFAALGEQPVRLEFTRPGPLLEQILVRVELDMILADGTAATEKFEYFYGGKLTFSGQNLRLDLSPIYNFPVPPKQRRYLKPDQILRTPHEGFNVVWGQGMFYDLYGVEAALKQVPQAKVLECVPYGGLLAEGLQNFPLSYEEMLRQDVIVLTNVSAGAVDDATAERIKDFVEAGGGLLVMGGPWSLGKGKYGGSKLGALLPAETVGPADFREVQAPLVPVTGKAFGAEASWAKDQPLCAILQEVKPRPGAEVRLTCGNYPALVTGTVGKGRTAVLPLTVMGQPPAGAVAWWDWPPWPATLAQTLTWLAGQ